MFLMRRDAVGIASIGAGSWGCRVDGNSEGWISYNRHQWFPQTPTHWIATTAGAEAMTPKPIPAHCRGCVHLHTGGLKMANIIAGAASIRARLLMQSGIAKMWEVKMTKPEALDTLMLLSALESWAFRKTR